MVGAALCGHRPDRACDEIQHHQEERAADDVPDPAGVGVPAQRGDQTGQDHADVGADDTCHQGVAVTAVQRAGQPGQSDRDEADEQKWRGEQPVQVAGVVDRPLHPAVVGEGVDALLAGHREVGARRDDADEGTRSHVVPTFVLATDTDDRHGAERHADRSYPKPGVHYCSVLPLRRSDASTLSRLVCACASLVQLTIFTRVMKSSPFRYA